jgi:hypothetical protein
MGDGEWKKRDPSTQRRMLDEVRPDGARPLTPEPKPPPVDAEFEADHPVASFSDLGPGLAAEQKDPTPVDAGQLDFQGDHPGVQADAESDPAPVESDVENAGGFGRRGVVRSSRLTARLSLHTRTWLSW